MSEILVRAVEADLIKRYGRRRKWSIEFVISQLPMLLRYRSNTPAAPVYTVERTRRLKITGGTPKEKKNLEQSPKLIIAGAGEPTKRFEAALQRASELRSQRQTEAEKGDTWWQSMLILALLEPDSWFTDREPLQPLNVRLEITRRRAEVDAVLVLPGQLPGEKLATLFDKINKVLGGGQWMTTEGHPDREAISQRNWSSRKGSYRGFDHGELIMKKVIAPPASFLVRALTMNKETIKQELIALIEAQVRAAHPLLEGGSPDIFRKVVNDELKRILAERDDYVKASNGKLN